MIYWEKQKKIKVLYELYSKPVREKYGLTQMEYSILLFLHRNPDCDTASSIVRTGRFTKSHVSAAVRTLTERGLIAEEYRGNNTKTIHLTMTAKAVDILAEAADAGEQYTNRVFAGFSMQDRLQMEEYFERLCANAEAELKNMEESEEYA